MGDTSLNHITVIPNIETLHSTITRFLSSALLPFLFWGLLIKTEYILGKKGTLII